MATPSRIARHVASALWPEVQQQSKVARGVFNFSCAGHGGLVAIVGAADIPSNHLRAARESGRLELVVIGSRRILSTCQGYTRESLVEWAERAGAEQIEVWPGEEDCDWATIALAVPAVLEGAVKARVFADCALEDDFAFDTCRRWCEDYLLALDPEYVIDPEGRMADQIRQREIIAHGGFVRYAWQICRRQSSNPHTTQERNTT